MEALYIMIPLTFLLSGSALFACLWAIKKGQYDDIETPPLRILNEDQNEFVNKSVPPLNFEKPKLNKSLIKN